MSGVTPRGAVAGVVDRYDAVFVDLDGVVFRADRAVPGAAEALDALRRRGVRMLFLTNNSARTSEQVAEKLAGMSVRASPDEILTSGMATADLLKREGYAEATAFVIGERGVRDPLEAAGVAVLDGAPDRADLVIVGWDRTVNYDKLRSAAVLVQRGARLVATNADATYPAGDGLYWPGAGSILASVVTATGAEPLVVGKPSAPLYEAAVERTGAENPLVVGDRLDTDVAGAAGMGWDAMLVLTGAHVASDLAAAEHLPVYLASDLSALLRDLPPARPRSAGETDVEAITALLGEVGLSMDGVEGRLADTVVFGDGASGVAATACIEAVGNDGLLGAVAVRPDLRSSGLGTLVSAAALHEARRRGLQGVWLFTEGAARFFVRLGFEAIDREAVPEVIAEGPQGKVCSTATVMTLRVLGPRGGS